MAGIITNLFVNIGAKIDDFLNGSNKVKSQAEKLGYSFENLRDQLVGVFAVKKIIDFAKEAVNLANAAEGIEMAFKRIGNKGILDDLRKETKGTVSDLELMKAAVQANNFNIPLEQLGKLLAFAHQRAKDTGQSVDYLVQSIVLGIGRKSPLILDNLGISAIALKEKLKGVGAEAATVGDVANAVGDIASEAMKKIGDAALTSKDKLDQAKASTQDWQLRIGQFLKVVGDGFASFIGQLDKAVTIQAKLLSNQNLSLWEKIGIIAKGNKKEVTELYDALKRTGDIQAESLYNSFIKQIQAIKDLDKATIQKITNDAKLNNESVDLAIQNEILARATSKVEDTYYNLIEQYGVFDEKRKSGQKLSDAEIVYFEKIQTLLLNIGKLKNDKTDLLSNLIFGAPGEQTLGIIESLEEKITDLKNKINKSESISFAAELTKDLQDTEKQLAKVKLEIDKLAFGEPAAKGLKPMQGKTATSVSSNVVDDKLLPGIESFSQKYEEVGKNIIDVSDQISNSIADLAESFGESLGNILQETGGFEDFGKDILLAVGSFMSMFGKQLVAIGVGKIVLDAGLSGPAAIAAGVALIALSGVAQSMASSGVSGSTHSVSTSATSGYSNRNNELTVQIEGVLKGQDIFWSQKNFNKKYNNVGS